MLAMILFINKGDYMIGWVVGVDNLKLLNQPF